MDPDLFPFVVNCLLLVVTNMHDAQKVTSSFKSKDTDGRTLGFAILHKDLGWR